MSTPAVSGNASLQQYFYQRRQDLIQLGQALQSGDMATALNDYNAIVNLGKSGPSPVGAPFGSASREQNFQAIGQALNAGDLAGALQAFEALAPPGYSSPATPSGSSSVGPDVVVNLSGNQ